MPFFARPNLDNDQFKQIQSTTLTLSGQTQIATVSGFTLTDGAGNNIPIIATGGTNYDVLTYLNNQIKLKSIIVNNGLTNTCQNIKLGGTLTENTFIDGMYTLNICGNAKLSTVSGYQISGITILRTSPNNISTIFFGEAGNSISSGANNIGMGYQALYYNCNGYNNFAVGFNSLRRNTNGSNNFSIGYQSLYWNTCGNNNIGLGYQSLWKNDIGSRNIAMGSQSMWNNTIGCNNVGLGFCSLYTNSIGCHNVALNCMALGSNTSGCMNTAIGTFALVTNSIGCHNIGLGHYAGYSNSTGCYNIFIGTCAGYSETGSGKLYIATGATKSLVYGDFSTNEITLPKVKLCETPATGADTDSVLVWNSSDKCVKQVSSNGLFGLYSVTGVSSNATLSADNQVVFVDTTSGSVTITLPAAATISNGKVYMIKNTACGLLNNVIIDSGASSTIDGSRCAIINTDYGALQLIRACTAGSNSIWYTLSFNN